MLGRSKRFCLFYILIHLDPFFFLNMGRNSSILPTFSHKRDFSCCQVRLLGRERCTPQTRSLATLPGSTPLLAAAGLGKEDLVELLMSYGAYPQANFRGETCESLAEANGHYNVLPCFQTFAVWSCLIVFDLIMFDHVSPQIFTSSFAPQMRRLSDADPFWLKNSDRSNHGSHLLSYGRSARVGAVGQKFAPATLEVSQIYSFKLDTEVMTVITRLKQEKQNISDSNKNVFRMCTKWNKAEEDTNEQNGCRSPTDSFHGWRQQWPCCLANLKHPESKRLWVIHRPYCNKFYSWGSVAELTIFKCAIHGTVAKGFWVEGLETLHPMPAWKSRTSRIGILWCHLVISIPKWSKMIPINAQFIHNFVRKHIFWVLQGCFGFVTKSRKSFQGGRGPSVVRVLSPRPLLRALQKRGAALHAAGLRLPGPAGLVAHGGMATRRAGRRTQSGRDDPRKRKRETETHRKQTILFSRSHRSKCESHHIYCPSLEDVLWKFGSVSFTSTLRSSMLQRNGWRWLSLGRDPVATCPASRISSLRKSPSLDEWAGWGLGKYNCENQVVWNPRNGLNLFYTVSFLQSGLFTMFTAEHGGYNPLQRWHLQLQMSSRRLCLCHRPMVPLRPKLRWLERTTFYGVEHVNFYGVQVHDWHPLAQKGSRLPEILGLKLGDHWTMSFTNPQNHEQNCRIQRNISMLH